MDTADASNQKTRKVTRVQFGILSPDDIREMSVCAINSPMTYNEGKPVERGLCDPRMGTVERDVSCQTCGGTQGECKFM